MRNPNKLLLLLSAILPLNFLMGNETTPLNLGASDLVPHARLDPFKGIEDQIKAHTWKWEPEPFKVDFAPNGSADSEFQLNQSSELERLQIEHKALKVRVSELESRVVTLEKHLRTQNEIN